MHVLLQIKPRPFQMKARMYFLLNSKYETLTLLFLPVDIWLSTLRLVRKHLHISYLSFGGQLSSAT